VTAFPAARANGVTRVWRAKCGHRCLTFREAATWGVTFTVFLTADWRVDFVYCSVRLRGRWFWWSNR
jgi:hypothetical protein